MGKGWKVGAAVGAHCTLDTSALPWGCREVQGQCYGQAEKDIAVIADGLRFGVEKSPGVGAVKRWDQELSCRKIT